MMRMSHPLETKGAKRILGKSWVWSPRRGLHCSLCFYSLLFFVRVVLVVRPRTVKHQFKAIISMESQYPARDSSPTSSDKTIMDGKFEILATEGGKESFRDFLCNASFDLVAAIWGMVSEEYFHRTNLNDILNIDFMSEDLIETALNTPELRVDVNQPNHSFSPSGESYEERSTLNGVPPLMTSTMYEEISPVGETATKTDVPDDIIPKVDVGPGQTSFCGDDIVAQAMGESGLLDYLTMGVELNTPRTDQAMGPGEEIKKEELQILATMSPFQRGLPPGPLAVSFIDVKVVKNGVRTPQLGRICIRDSNGLEVLCATLMCPPLEEGETLEFSPVSDLTKEDMEDGVDRDGILLQVRELFRKRPFLILQGMSALHHSSIYRECQDALRRAEGEFICLQDKFRYPSTGTPCGLRGLVLAFLVEGIPGCSDSSVSVDFFNTWISEPKMSICSETTFVSMLYGPYTRVGPNFDYDQWVKRNRDLGVSRGARRHRSRTQWYTPYDTSFRPRTGCRPSRPSVSSVWMGSFQLPSPQTFGSFRYPQ